MELDADVQITLSSKWSYDNFNEPEFALVAKGKRTKRTRQQPPPQERAAQTALPAESSSTSASASASIAEEASAGSIITEEEEDMANCLILLAQGGGLRNVDQSEDTAGVVSAFSPSSCKDTAIVSTEKFTATATVTTNKAGVFVYECKTCNKCFSSFQALGGHRASHKKLKLTSAAATEDVKPIIDHEEMLQISMNSFSKTLFAENKAGSRLKTKVHECSICGAEFNSGQALGGHMRRHRPLVPATVADNQGNIKERNMLSLDLNLPAPASDDCYEPEFGFVTPWLAISN